jgi:polysaccharide deacetylase 2 family uncharacterized protein YibQ
VARNRKVARNRRKKEPHRKAYLVLVLIALFVISGTFYFLGKQRVVPPKQPTVVIRSAERQKMPPREAKIPGAMEDYSSIVVPVPGALRIKKRLQPGQGAIAIIIDDLGNSRHEADLLLAINLPMTFSIIPGLANARAVAESAHRNGREVMVHIPMEPKNVQGKPFEKNGLLLALSDEEIEKRLRGYIDSVPFAVGANNHMGSRFTEDRTKMRTVLKVLKEKKLYFVDSKTSPASIGDVLAREMGIHTAARTVFLDNEENVDAIRAQIAKLAGIARKTGGAIGICHPHKATIQALSLSLPALKAEGISFVPASELTK